MRRLCALAVLGLGVFAGGEACAQEIVDNGCTDVNGVRYGNCSRLDKGDGRVTIKATDCGNPDSAVPNCGVSASTLYSPTAEAGAPCRTLHNADHLDYFVPWKTAEEWGKFLAWVQGPGAARGLTIHPCCLPRIGTVCADQLYNGTPIGPEGLPVLDPVTGTPIQLGKRLLGMRSGGVGDYGAHNDVSDTLDASVLLGNNMINYKVTYVCDGGDWVKTFEEGSCTPLDGACGTSVPATGVSPLTMTALQQQNLLCVSGSIMQNLVDHGTYWSWDCLGTPTRATATCTTANTDTNSGTAQCGAANFGRLPGMPSGLQLCSGGMPSIVGGIGTEASPWVWSCNDGDGNSAGCLAYHQGTKLDGICGSSNGETADNPGWTPGEGTNLCANGTQVTAAGVVKTGNVWNWSCAGENGGSDTACAASAAYLGRCGAADYTAGTTPPKPSRLCRVGTPSAVTQGPALEGHGLIAWLWTCEGATPCNGDMQCWCERIDTNGPQPGVCGRSSSTAYWSDNSTVYTETNPPDGALCELGSDLVAPPVWNAAALHWEWQCRGLNGGTTTGCETNTVPGDAECMYDTSSWVVTPSDPLPADACRWGFTPINQAISGSTYTFTCPGFAGGASAQCAVGYDAVGIYGICGYTKGDVLGTGSPPPVNTLCSSGTPSDQGFDPDVPARYAWRCQGSTSGLDDWGCHVFVNAQPGICGAAHNTERQDPPYTDADLCVFGDSSVVEAADHIYNWTCQGISGTAATYCHTTFNSGSGSGDNGVCGSANGSQVTVAPTSNLCSMGTATAVSGTGPWTWSCVGNNGGTTAACIATQPTATGPGACGTTDGTTIPARPNANLCSMGIPSVVAGSGPWTWDCIGTTTASCSANICAACAGTVTGVPKSETVAVQSINYGGGTCTVSGTVNWNGTDNLSSNNAAQALTLGNSASGLSFSKAAVPGSAPSTYCPPCYRRAQTISGSFMVQKSGVCAGTLDDGAPATIVIDSVQIQ